MNNRPRCWLKDGVSLRNVQPQIIWAMERTKDVFFSRNLNCVFTSVYRDPKQGSLHHGWAFDADTDKELNMVIWYAIKDDIEMSLGKEEFDVVVHDAGSGLHVHVEFDPPWRDKAERVPLPVET